MPNPQIQPLRQTPIQTEEIGFRVWRGTADAMAQMHSHSDIELNYVLRGAARYFLSNRFVELRTGQLATFWAGAPHQLVEVAEPLEMIWVTLPLSWFLQWDIGERITQTLLHGEALLATDEGANDETALQRWCDDLAAPSQERQKIVLLELEARLRRLALSLENDAATTERTVEARLRVAGSGEARHVERMAAYLSEHYREPIALEKVAGEWGLHPHYAMQVFKAGCGMTLWNYLLQLRLSHAQRLLLTTNWSVGRIAEDAGFESLSRFHALFKRHCGCTPRAFRVRHELENLGS